MKKKSISGLWLSIFFAVNCFSQGDTAEVNKLNENARQLLLVSENDSALTKVLDAQQLASAIKFDLGLATAYSIAGLIFSSKGNNNAAQESYLHAMQIFKAINNKKGIANVYNNMGLVCWERGFYPDALRNYFAALKIKIEIGDKKGTANTYNNIGLIYWNQENNNEALSYYKMALKLKLEINDMGGSANTYSNIGIIYYEQRKYEEALKNHFLALKIRKEMGDRRGISNSYNNVGIVYYTQHKYEESLSNFLSALKIREQIGDKLGIANSCSNIGKLYIDIKKRRAAGKILERGLSLAKETKSKEEIKLAYEGLAKLGNAVGNYKQALLNYKLFIAYRDSLLNEENTKKSVQQQMQYDFDKKGAADSIKNAEAKRLEEISHQSQIRNQKLYTYVGLSGFLVMIVIAGISFVAFRNKKKANIEIARQKHIVEEKQKEILDSIYYARRIQRALITSEKYINKNFTRLKNTNG